MIQTTFTEHAFERVLERLSLTSNDVARILDEDKCCPIGNDVKGKHKLHRLIYSKPDNYWFVAVQDDRNGEVITILPVDYHHRWRISYQALVIARSFFTGEKVPNFSDFEIKPQNMKPAKFKFMASYTRKKVARVRLGFIPTGNYENVQAVEKDLAVHKQIQLWLEEKGFVGIPDLQVWIKWGNNGKTTKFNFEPCE